MKLGITGAAGLLGYHLRARLHAQGNKDVRLADRATFADAQALEAFVHGLDGIVHFAGMNRGGDTEVARTNVALALSLVTALQRTGARPALVYANSIHVDRDTAYGRSKRAAAEILEAWAQGKNGEKGADAPFCDLRLPNVFGEFGRPFYNSVVSTFCQQIAVGETPQIQIDAIMDLMHAQDVARRVLDALSRGERGCVRVPGTPLSVSALLEKLRALHGAYMAQIVPALCEPLDVQLFNTLRSYLFPKHYPVSLKLHSDPRGSLFEVIKSGNGGQVFMSTTRPGVTRGNHFHTRKVERFLVAGGEADISLRKLFTNEVTTFRVRGSEPCYIDMPTFHTHNITNTGLSELTTLFWTNEIFDPADTDTYPEMVTPA